jgi:hypothetical protein
VLIFETLKKLSWGDALAQQVFENKLKDLGFVPSPGENKVMINFQNFLVQFCPNTN